MYGCFWCSVQGHLIKGECTPVTEGRAASACNFSLGQSQILILGKYTPLSLSQRGRVVPATFPPNRVTIHTQARPSKSCMHVRLFAPTDSLCASKCI